MPNVSQDNKRFPFGPTLPGSMNFIGQAGTELSAQAAEIIDHRFIFWHINDGTTKKTSTNSSFTETIGTLPFKATAWYIKLGGNGCVAIRPYAFSITSNSALNETPIDSVTPANAWNGGDDNTVDVNQSTVKVTAKQTLNGENFDSWMIFGNATANGRVLTVPKGNCPLVIATYKADSGSIIPIIPDFGDELIEWLDVIKEHIDPRIDPIPFDILRLRDVLRTSSRRVSKAAPKTASKKTVKKKIAKKTVRKRVKKETARKKR